MKAQAHSYESVVKDISVELFPDNKVYQLRNGRLTSDAGTAIDGGIINIRGNKHSFTIPEGKYILGHVCVVDKVYLLTTDSLTEEGGPGYIYCVTVSPKTLESTIKLVYFNEELKCSVYRIFQMHGIKENSKTERIYFSDHDSETRAFNAITIPLNGPIEFTQIHPNASFEAPIVDIIFEGGTLRRGIYEYAFYATTFDGKKSLLSENSVQVSLIGSGFTNAATYRDSKVVDDDMASPYFGNTLSSNKSVKIKIDVSSYPVGLYITVTAIAIYSKGDIEGIDVEPEVSEIGTVLLNEGKASFIHSGTESEVIFSYEDYLDNRYPFFTNKTFSSKDNVLLVGNTKNPFVDAKYDAKTFRYNKWGGTYTDPYKNFYNDESGKRFGDSLDGDTLSWNNDQFKYQNPSSGSEEYLGGSGANIDYKFILHPLENSDTIVNESLSFEQEYPSRFLDNHASPYLRFLRGFKRGEIYRFAIVFTNSKGNKSFAEYIGDIKMPELSEKAGYITIPGTNVDYFPIALDLLNLNNSGNLPHVLNSTNVNSLSTTVYSYTATTEENLNFDWNISTQFITLSYVGYIPVEGTGVLYRLSLNGVVLEELEVFWGVGGVGATTYDEEENLFQYLDISLVEGDELVLEAYIIDPSIIDPDIIDPDPVPQRFIVYIYLRIPFTEADSDPKKFYSLGVEFNVKNIPEGFDSYQICMVPREDRFKTRLAQGYGTKTYESTGSGGNTGVLYPRGQPSSIAGFYADGPNNYGQDRWSNRSVIPLHFPEVSYDTIDLTSYGSTYLKPIGAYSDCVVKAGFGSTVSTNLTDFYTQSGDFKIEVRGNFKSTKPFSNYRDIAPFLFEKVKVAQKFGTAAETTIMDGTSIYNYLYRYSTQNASNINGYSARSGTKLFIRLEKPDGNNIFGSPNFAGINLGKDMFIFDYIRLLPEHYGGNDIHSISKNIFKPITRPIYNTGPAKVFGGDIFISEYDSMYGMFDNTMPNPLNGTAKSYYRNVVVPVESTINIDVAHGKTLSQGAKGVDGSWQANEIGNLGGIPYFDYENTYSIFSLGRPHFIKPLNFNIEQNYPTRIYSSDTKIYGEQIDSWTKFRVNQFKDLDPSYGSLTKLATLKNIVLFLQEEGMGLLSINPRAVVSPSDGIPTELGTSKGLQDYTYISTESGTKHHLSVVISDSSLSYYDVVANRWMMYSAGEKGGLLSLGETKSFQSIFLDLFEDNTNFQDSDSPYVEGGVVSFYDPTHREFYMTFHGLLCPKVIDPLIPQNIVSTEFYVTPGGTIYQAIKDFTVVTNNGDDTKPSTDSVLEDYQSSLITDPEIQQGNSITLVWSEKKNCFNDVYDHKPFLYFGDNKNVFSSSPLNSDQCFIHNKGNYGEFYNVTYPFQISLIVNGSENKPLNKILSHSEYNAIVKKGSTVLQDKSFDTIRVYNDYQDSQELALDSLPNNSEHERRFRKWRFNMPLDFESKDYIRGPWSVLTLSCNNLENYTLAFQTLINYYTENEH